MVKELPDHWFVMIVDKEKSTDGDTRGAAAAFDNLRRLVQDDFLFRQCIQFQKRRVYIIGPAILLIALWGTWMSRAWQVALIAAVVMVTELMFALGYRYARRRYVEKSLWLAVLPTLATCMSVIALLDGFDVAMVLTSISLVVQSSVFSRRISLAGAIGILFLVIIASVLDMGVLYNRLELTRHVTLTAATAISLIMTLQFWVYLRKHHDNSLVFMKKQTDFFRGREQIFRSVADAIPSVEKSVGQTSGISSDVASRAMEQAEAIQTMTDTLTFLNHDASSTAKFARKSVQISEGMQMLMADNFKRLKDAANNSENVVVNMQQARKIMMELVAQTDNVEKILSYNRTIGEHIKVLSVNASIEAAEAGEYGAGFAVVARELTEMIDSTEKNLLETANMLNDIRIQSNAGMSAIDITASMLDAFFDELTCTRDTLEKAVASSNAAIRQISQIVQGAQKQQGELVRMGKGVQILLDNTFELAVSSALLQDTVSHMDELKASLASLVTPASVNSVSNDF